MVYIVTGILAAIFVLILWVILVPVYVSVDTHCNRYEVNQKGIASIALHPGRMPLLKMRILGVAITRPLKIKRKKQRPESPVSSKKRGLKRSLASWLYLMKGAFRSFRIIKLKATIDFDDVVCNAQLVPVMLLLSRGNVDVSTNFIRQNYLILLIEWRPYKLLWTWITFLTKK